MDSLGPRPYDFMKGYDTKPRSTKYMNLGFVSSPYPGKTGVGDYGPTQGGGVYYNPWNPTYPYPLDFPDCGSTPQARGVYPGTPNEDISASYAQDIPEFIRASDQMRLKLAKKKATGDGACLDVGGPCGSCK